MAAPPKPWERIGVNNQRVNSSTSLSDQMACSLPVLSQPISGMPNISAPARTPPPLPARNSLANNRSTFNGGYGYGGYSGFGGYGGYGGAYSSPYSMYNGMYGGGYGMNRYGGGFDDGAPGGFAQQAELSSRQAFQSIESVVQAVGSVAAMLESTFQAVYNSFRAVIGVADHMSRLRAHMTRIFSALAIFRTVRWLLMRLLHLLRLRDATGLDDGIWSQASSEAGAVASNELVMGETSRSSWPIMLFFGIIVAGPWLIWKFLSSLSGSTGNKGWASGADDHFVAVAEFDFEAENPDELSFTQGSTLNVAPKELQPNVRGWLLASVDGQKTGLIPANYVKIKGKRRGQKARAAPTPAAGKQQQQQQDELQSVLGEQFDAVASSSSSAQATRESADFVSRSS